MSLLNESTYDISRCKMSGRDAYISANHREPGAGISVGPHINETDFVSGFFPPWGFTQDLKSISGVGVIGLLVAHHHLLHRSYVEGGPKLDR